jgi:hypothetical protein
MNVTVFDAILVYTNIMNIKLEKFINSDDCYLIHYSSSGFFDGCSPAPKISCIVVYNLKNGKKGKFSISDYIDKNIVEQSEKLLFLKFKNFLEQTPHLSFVHWNIFANRY